MILGDIALRFVVERGKKKHHKGIVSLMVSLAGYANSEKWCEIRG